MWLADSFMCCLQQKWTLFFTNHFCRLKSVKCDCAVQAVDILTALYKQGFLTLCSALLALGVLAVWFVNECFVALYQWSDSWRFVTGVVLILILEKCPRYCQNRNTALGICKLQSDLLLNFHTQITQQFSLEASFFWGGEQKRLEGVSSNFAPSLFTNWLTEVKGHCDLTETYVRRILYTFTKQLHWLVDAHVWGSNSSSRLLKKT